MDLRVYRRDHPLFVEYIVEVVDKSLKTFQSGWMHQDALSFFRVYWFIANLSKDVSLDSIF